MFNRLGLSVYLSTFDIQKEMLERFEGRGYYVFTSFHIQEEYRKMGNYKRKAREICNWLKERQFKIMADVSSKTLEFFQYDSIIEFAKDMEIDVLRLKYRFREEEILNIAKEYPLSFNPSTEGRNIAKDIVESGKEVFALHNFYPRPETGLDPDDFIQINDELRDLGIEPLAFIAGDEMKRGPIHEGLPSLEKHRDIPPYVAYLDLFINYGIKGIFVGDVMISQRQSQLIDDYIEDGIINIPVEFLPKYEYLYDQVFTIRAESPKAMMRLQESREYSNDGEKTQGFNCITRKKGSITMDNAGYKRYSGEIQILRKDLPQDNRVNVIGSLDNGYLDIMNC